MAGFFSRKSKNGVSTPAEPAAVSPDAQSLYEPIPTASSLIDEPPDSIAGIPDLYGVLGVDPRSSDDVIRYAYRKKAAKLLDARWRPGRAARQLAEVNAAYEILGKPDRRADYDRQRARLSYYQQAARQEVVSDATPAAAASSATMRTHATRSAAPWRAPRAPRGLLEVIAIIGVVAVALYAGYTVLGNGAWVNLGSLQDAGAALGLPVKPRTAPEPTVAPVLAQPSPTPRQVLVPQVAIPSPTAAAAPPPAAAPAAGPVRSSARVSNPAPPRRSEISVILRLTRDNRPLPNVPVYLVAHYRTVDERFPAGDGSVPTNDQGEATITFNVGDATAGHQVNVDVIAQVEGETVQTQASFIPR
ncbi:MAG: J domain-containing protein [Chloroflexi bacterium]|nr:J domain-containing protein [Chloroflexota bacterium]